MDTQLIPACELAAIVARIRSFRASNRATIYYGPDKSVRRQSSTPAKLREEFGWPAEPRDLSYRLFYPRMRKESGYQRTCKAGN